jgi:hypothetical protein
MRQIMLSPADVLQRVDVLLISSSACLIHVSLKRARYNRAVVTSQYNKVTQCITYCEKSMLLISSSACLIRVRPKHAR